MLVYLKDFYGKNVISGTDSIRCNSSFLLDDWNSQIIELRL